MLRAVNRLETRGPMMKFSAIFCAQLIVSAVALSMSGAAQAQDIGCVDGTPAPPITHSCPSTSATGAYASAPAPTRVRAHVKHKNTVQ